MHRLIESVAALARSLADNREAALAEYRGKVLELSGTGAEKVVPGGLNPTIGVAFEGIDDRLAFDANLSFVAFDPEDRTARSQFEALSVGDAVTVRCRMDVLNESGTLFLVNDCRVV
ncbi:MAG: hypothetical protein WEB90_03775 [Gemmatimonadota bacterium]